MPGNDSALQFPAVTTRLEANEELGYASGNAVRSDRDRRDRRLRFRFYCGYGCGDSGFDELDLRAGPVPDGNPAARPGRWVATNVCWVFLGRLDRRHADHGGRRHLYP